MRTGGCSVTDGGVRAALIEFTVNFGDGGQLGCGYSTERFKLLNVRNLFFFFMSYRLVHLCSENSDSDCCFYLGSEINDPRTHGDADKLRKHTLSQRLQQLCSHVSMSLQT